MAPTTQPVPIDRQTGKPAKPGAPPPAPPSAPPSATPPSAILAAPSTASLPASDDGTAQLLKWGGWILAVGLFCALLTRTLFGGIGPQGPHTNAGWLALIVTMMCLPFGSLLFLLGALKWLRNRRESNRANNA